MATSDAVLQHDGRADERRRMVDRQIAGRGIADEDVLDAMREVPREAFLPPELHEFAYVDSALPIAEGQTISQPYIVALMAEAATLGPGDRVLEIGGGSGYAAAVYARLARSVLTIERHARLAHGARQAIERLGIGNVEVVEGDGSRGWPEQAPFDAILVAAGAPTLPEELKQQLADGGRLVIPVSVDGHQDLRRIIRHGERFEEESLGAVAFVPLVGEAAAPEEEAGGQHAGYDKAEVRRPAVLSEDALPAEIRRQAHALEAIDGAEIAGALDGLAQARVVLLGEATHGTAEFYRARAALTRHLVEHHGFDVVAAEADWSDATRIDRYVRHREAGLWEEPAFVRFPTWMWRNQEFHEFTDWMREWNAARPAEARVSFHGLDLYGMSASMAAVIDYLERVDPEAARIARERYGCLSPWQKDPAAYGRAAMRRSMENCEKPVLKMLQDLLGNRMEYLGRDGADYLDAEGNARVVAAAEEYYRTIYYGSASSWNLRDEHMFETLERVLDARGPASRAIVWAHNSHIGDASATEMGLVRDELNIGELARRRFGDEAYLVGFGTDRGQVAAASDWDGPMEVKTVRPAHPDSYEVQFRRAGVSRSVLDLRRRRGTDLGHTLLKPRLERAIGVIYRPETELASHYFEASLPRQFDGYIWFEVTAPVTPLPAEARPGMPETYPFGL